MLILLGMIEVIIGAVLLDGEFWTCRPSATFRRDRSAPVLLAQVARKTPPSPAVVSADGAEVARGSGVTLC